ncbi:peroxiredoxin [Methanocella sp. CWC-04]|uniref:Peroxiredoxin n=1 Tax=Methanooceanicella nereidis TaxID=2052831 RepID=A0AAP2RD65_9EURY|nr:redoxin domain-containing protein [Methanocella sp. CWC-04]MCD1294711.1 peroxiredoxin [Methanocella sp. CWC-04]
MLRINHEVPDFEADAFHKDEIRRVRLSDYRGNWVILIFYPADFTFVCPTELEEIAEHYDEIRDLGADVLSISRDTAFVHKAWHDNSPAIKKIKFPMVADTTGNICRDFGTYDDKDGLSLRGTFLVDPDGMLKSIEIHDNSFGRSAKEIIRKLQAAKFVREHAGNVCPASWEPGKEALTPGLEMVGKI